MQVKILFLSALNSLDLDKLSILKSLKNNDSIMRLIQNLTISWEMNFYVKNWEKVGKYLLSLSKKSIFKIFVNENLIFT
jgi:hypothetical protein